MSSLIALTANPKLANYMPLSMRLVMLTRMTHRIQLAFYNGNSGILSQPKSFGFNHVLCYNCRHHGKVFLIDRENHVIRFVCEIETINTF